MSFDSTQSQELIEHGDRHQAQGMFQRIAQRSPKVSQPKAGIGSYRRTLRLSAHHFGFLFLHLSVGKAHVATQWTGWDSRAAYELWAILAESAATHPAHIVRWPFRMVVTG